MFWSTPLKPLIFKFLLLGALAACGSAQAVICNSLTATSIPLTTLYVSGSATQLTGTIRASCKNETTDSGGGAEVYIGINQGKPPAGRAMTRQNGSEALNYEIYHANFGSGVWNEARGVASTDPGNGGVIFRLAGGNTTTFQTFSFTYYFSIPAGQASAPAGIYDDLAIGVTARNKDFDGIVLAATSFGVSASIQSSCYFSSAPAPLTINYSSFSATLATGNTAFQLSCTYDSPYTLTIDPPASGTLLGLNYSLALSAPSGTGTAGPQSFSVTGTVAAGQSGNCATGSCSASRTHTITVGF